MERRTLISMAGVSGKGHAVPENTLKYEKPFRPQDLEECNDRIRRFFDRLAEHREDWIEKNLGYHKLIEQQYQSMIPTGCSILDVGCGTGRLLSSLRPSVGVGLDLSSTMVEIARKKYGSRNIEFVCSAIENYEYDGEPFDYIVFSDVLSYFYNIQAVFERVSRFSHPRTRIICNFYSRLWQPLLQVAEALNLKAKLPVLNWVTKEDVEGFLRMSGYEVIRSCARILFPKTVPLFSGLMNKYLSAVKPFEHLCLANFVVARPELAPFPKDRAPRVSVVVPCRNEAGNIRAIVERTPEMGRGTELLFIEGGSTDATFDACLDVQKEFRDKEIKVKRQEGVGKGDAVRLGFQLATGDVLMILDADMTVPPEDLVHFYRALVEGKAEFVNGSRLVYSMEPEAMRFLNLCANKFFGYAFTFLLGQRVKDTLCGTKVLTKADYERVISFREYFGEIDPFGDFDLLFGAAKLNLKIQDLPIRYRDRVYGETNISRFRHGLMLLEMCYVALKKLKFI
ncbi:MAG: glycosyltransferase [bacterium]